MFSLRSFGCVLISLALSDPIYAGALDHAGSAATRGQFTRGPNSQPSHHPATVELMMGSVGCTATALAPSPGNVLGYVLTAAHCIQSQTGYILVPGHKEHFAVRCYADRLFATGGQAQDRALCAIVPGQRQAVAAALKSSGECLSSKPPRVGENVELIGYGVTSDGAPRRQNKTTTRIELVDPTRLQLHDGKGNATTEGDSGGGTYALRDGKRELIAINSGSDKDAYTISVRTDSEPTRDFLRRARARFAEDFPGQSDPGICGTEASQQEPLPIPPPTDSPTTILSVESKSVAEAMGLRVGDRLTHVGDRAVSSTKDVLAGLDSAFGDKSQVLFVEFERNGKRHVRGLALSEEQLARKEGRLGVGLAKAGPSQTVPDPRVPAPSKPREAATPAPRPPPPMQKTPEPTPTPTPRARVHALASFDFRNLAEDSKTMSLLNRCAQCHGVAEGNQPKGRFAIAVDGISIEGFFNTAEAARHIDSRVEEMAARVQPPATPDEIRELREWLQKRAPDRRKK